ncbi:MAG TPA: acetoacetate--CoA ligase [Pseudonocardiaceae bacterium]|jgi:acetoacetyl-CoA synthetase|nr:acetoacetate--CoA ligase [Pseudonocardiaceae bacterium]
MTVAPGELMWTPPPDVLDGSRIGAFLAWLAEHRGLCMTTYDQLWRWSVADLAGFWSAVWEHFDVRSAYDTVLARREMPGAVWFPGARLNYAEYLLRQGADEDIAVLGRSQTRPDVDLTFGELRDQVARARTVLAGLGVGPGDRVAGYLPNVPEALVAFLATAGLGAVWTTCASEFGTRGVVDRFAQLEPVMLFVAGGYRYGDNEIDRRAQVAEIRAALPTVRHVLDIRYGPWQVEDALAWPDLVAAAEPASSDLARVPFDHPLFVLFSSGTTGIPKAIVHGHGGILVEHLKNHALSWDLGPGDRLLWYTTTAWMMWQALVSALLVGTSIVMVDGDPAHPDLTWQWRLAADARATMLGVSPGFTLACRKTGVDVRGLGLAVRTVGAAGSPMPPEGYAWLREQLGPAVLINVGSGGTDVCSGIVQGAPLLPVHAGRIAARALAVDVHAFDAAGQDVVGVPGELVITAPMPSMPLRFWNDADGSRLRAAYFDVYPGVWRQGDWIVFAPDGTCQVTGRSDATLNRGGVRMGTAEFYRVVEELPEITDSLVVHLDGTDGRLLLFVVLAPGAVLDDVLRGTIVTALRQALSPRHVPDDVVAVPAIPRNRTGKKLELPVKRILQGEPPSEVASRDALSDPASLDTFVALAAS